MIGIRIRDLQSSISLRRLLCCCSASIIVLGKNRTPFVAVDAFSSTLSSSPLLRKRLHSTTRRSFVAAKMATGEKEYAPSQFNIDETTGEKWRLCCGAAVLNSKNQVLVGKRVGSFDVEQWQCPQGGVDDTWTPNGETIPRAKETILGACNRELFEEMGLEVGKHVIVDQDLTPDHASKGGIRYRTDGSNNWLTKSGFAGQEIYWTIYRSMDGRGDLIDPEIMCDLSGLGGESPEFSAVKWRSIDDVVSNIWEKKREPYAALQSILNENKSSWRDKIRLLDLSGKWSRDNGNCVDVVNGLVMRGLTLDEASKEASKPYMQSFERKIGDDGQNSPLSWIVTTFDADGTTPRRKLDYSVGEWEEDYKGNTVIFGSSGKESKTTLTRRTAYIVEPDSEPVQVSHVTITYNGPRGGMEESRRYMKNGKLINRRTFWPPQNDAESSPSSPVISTEIFNRVQ